MPNDPPLSRAELASLSIDVFKKTIQEAFTRHLHDPAVLSLFQRAHRMNARVVPRDIVFDGTRITYTLKIEHSYDWF